MPGTGKTTVISQLVQLLVKKGKRVLLSAYTHSAVDNIMLKLKPLEVNMLRLGNANSVHPDMAPYLLNELQDECSSTSAMHELYRSAMVVGTTCLGANHMLLSKQRFDYCIVDEASQITQVLTSLTCNSSHFCLSESVCVLFVGSQLATIESRRSFCPGRRSQAAAAASPLSGGSTIGHGYQSL
jgi:cellulose biosynthesis protein BcsQ